MNQVENQGYLARLDEAQRQAVLARQSCVVTAGAGAGKTTVLAARFVHLVVDRKIPLRSILALTFTKKAAAQMYERIYQALADQESPWAREQLEDFQNAQITTIDSFCTTILRSGARDFGYTPEFTVDAKICADLAFSIAQRYISRHRNEDGIKELLASFSPDDVARSLFMDLGTFFISPLALRDLLFQPMAESLRALVAEKSDESLGILKTLSEEILSFARNLILPKKDCLAAIETSAGFLSILKTLDQPLPGAFPAELLQAIRDFSGLSLRAYAKSESETEIKNRAKKAREESVRLGALLDYKAFLPAHIALLKRLDEYALELAEAKRQANVLDFKDLGLCAVEVLKFRKDIRDFWKLRIDSIMIDEFQDNNHVQKDLLYLLAENRGSTSEGIPSPADLEEGKLFFVGDEKQSIYRFRGADVSVFKRLSAELGLGSHARSSGEPTHADIENAHKLSLPSNYRSSSGLLRFFNQFFAGVLDGGRSVGCHEGNSQGEKSMAEAEEAKVRDLDYTSFEADYRAMLEGSPSSQGGFHSSIGYYLMESQEGQEAPDEQGEEGQGPDQGVENDDDRLAFEVADFIRKNRGLLKVRPALAAQGEAARPSEFDDFAILLRSTTHQHRLERQLRRLSIPYQAESPRGLYSDSPANDIYHILRYAINPTDRAAYAALLRSPLARQSDEAFLELLSNQDRESASTRLSERDTSLLCRMEAFIEELRHRLASLSVADLVEYVWHKAGLRLDILSRPEAHSFLEHFDFIHHLAALTDKEGKPLSAFLEALGSAIEGSGEAPELDNVPRRLQGGVRILTIHKAKGLEFPIVILPWIETSGRSGRSQKLWQMLPEGLAVDLKPYDAPGASATNILYSLGKEREEAMEIAEIKRLLYVACTRAEDHLFFFAKNRKTADQKGRSFKYYLDAFCCPLKASGENLLELQNLPCRPVEKSSTQQNARTKIPDYRNFYQRYSDAEPLKQKYPRSRLSVTMLNAAARSESSLAASAATATEAETAGSSSVLPGQSSVPPELFGSLCHDMTDYAIRNAQAEGYKPADQLAQKLGSELLPAALEAAKNLVEAFLASEFWRKASTPVTRIKTESSFLYALGGFYIEGRMDLLIENRQECIVVDFKTDEHLDPREYRVQLDIYRRAVQSLTGGKVTKACLYWLRTGQIFWLEESISDEALVTLAKQAALSAPSEEDHTATVLE